MQFNYLDSLKNEFKKYTGFTVSEKIRDQSNRAVLYLSASESLCLPIEDPQCPIIDAFSLILQNKKFARYWKVFISNMCMCLKTDVFTGDGYRRIIRTLESVALDVDYDSGIKIIQFTTSCVGNKFLDLNDFRCILSLSFGMCNSSLDLLKTASLAAVEQIINEFIEYIIQEKDGIAEISLNEINKYFVDAFGKDIEMGNSLFKIAYLIIRDLAMICNGESTMWINDHKNSSLIAFEILNKVYMNYYDVFIKEKSFLNLIAYTLVGAEKTKAHVSFSVNCLYMFLEAIPEQCKNHFIYFLNDLRKNDHPNVNTLLFFRALFLKKSSFVICFFKVCDPDAKLLGSLIQQSRKLCDLLVMKENVQLSLNFSNYETNSDFIYSAPIEIALSFIRECYNSVNDPSIVKLVVAIWSDILVIISIAMRWVHIDSCHILLQSLYLLINLSYELKMDDVRGPSISAFCAVLLSNQEEIKMTAYDTIIYAIQSSPDQFFNFWYRILSSLSEFQWHPTSFDFSISTSKENVIEMADSLVSLQSGYKSNRDWSLSLLSELLISNYERFTDIWPAISEKYFHLFDSDFEIALDYLNKFILKGFCKQNEELILSIIEKIIENPNSHDILLDTVKTILIQNSSIIMNGWHSLFKILLPINFHSELENLNHAFSCLQMICNDILFTLSESVQSQFVYLIFEYIKQEDDANISLSSFELIWNIVPITNTAEQWKSLFEFFLNSFIDQRVDVSLCGIKTFFALITSNTSSLQKEVLEYLGKNYFLNIIDKLHQNPIKNDPSISLSFYEISHCGRTLWKYFADYKEFTDDLWSKLIALHSNFMRTCNDRELVISSFSFYEELFQCKELDIKYHDELFKSLNDLAKYLIPKENAKSVLYGPFGRMIMIVLPTQKDNLNLKKLDQWINIIGYLICEIPSGNFLPPTTHRTLDALVSLLPLPDEFVFKIYVFIVSLACNKINNVRLTEVSIDHLQEICKKSSNNIIPKLFILSKNLFNLPEAKNLLLFFLEKDIEIDNEIVDNVFSSLMELYSGDSNLSFKAGLSILKLFPKLKDEQKSTFINNINIKHEYKIEIELWKLYLDPSSDKFNHEIALTFTKKIVSSIGKKLSRITSEEELVDYLTFIRDIKTYGKAFGSNENITNRHIIFLISTLSDLILHPKDQIRKLIREIFLQLDDNNQA